MYRVVMRMVVIAAQPIVVGAWLKAYLLTQHVEYYNIQYAYKKER